MGFDEEAVTDEQREACAVVVMRTMLEDCVTTPAFPFDDDALTPSPHRAPMSHALRGAQRQWAEGPDNLRFVWGAGAEERLASARLARGLLAETDGAPWQYLPFTS